MGANLTYAKPFDSPLPDSERVTAAVTLTARDGVWAARADTDNTRTKLPRYSEPGKELPDEHYTRYKDLRVYRRARVSSLFDAGKYCGYHATQVLYIVQPDGKTTRDDVGPLVSVHPPDTSSRISEFDIPVLASGRGYSVWIDQITQAVVQPNGVIECKAKGRYSSLQGCTWELTIEPASNYLVRKARCLHGNGTVVVDVSNTGTRLHPAGILPESGRYVFTPRPEYREENAFDVTYESFTDQPDDDLISTNSKLLLRAPPDGTEVMDYRGDTIKRVFVGQQKPTTGDSKAPVVSPPPMPSFRWWLYLSASVLAVVLLIVYGCYWMKKPPTPPTEGGSAPPISPSIQ